MGVEDPQVAGRHEPNSAPDGDPSGAPEGGPVGGAYGGPVGDQVLPAATPTGDERVDEALTRLGGLGRAPVAGHVEIFSEVHQRLQDVLASIDQDGPRPSAPPRP
jgi:hypothetical protein